MNDRACCVYKQACRNVQPRQRYDDTIYYLNVCAQSQMFRLSSRDKTCRCGSRYDNRLVRLYYRHIGSPYYHGAVSAVFRLADYVRCKAPRRIWNLAYTQHERVQAWDLIEFHPCVYIGNVLYLRISGLELLPQNYSLNTTNMSHVGRIYHHSDFIHGFIAFSYLSSQHKSSFGIWDAVSTGDSLLWAYADTL